MSSKGKSKQKTEKIIDETKQLELIKQQQTQAKQELRKRLDDELKNTKINKLKLLNQWRKMMRLVKAESLRKEIDILSQSHERDVDRKDAILQMLDRDLEEAEDQYQLALRIHLNNIDNIIKLHDSRLYILEKTFQNELKFLLNDFNHEKENIINNFKQEKKTLTTIINDIEKEEEDRENDSKHSFEQLREEIRNRNLEDINMLRISLDTQIEDLEQQFELAHLNYLQQTAQRTHDFKELTKNDQNLSQEIELRRKKIDNLQTSIQHWRSKIRQLNRETEERNRLLREEKNSIQHHYQQLKQRIQIYRGTQNQRLLQLSQSANSCKEVIQEKLDQAKRILQLSEFCRKLETMEEQILPFVPIDDDAIKEEQTKRSNQSATTSHKTAVLTDNGSIVPSSDRLANFHRRLNKVVIDNIAISKEKDRLINENSQLEDLIQQYLDGTKVNENTLNADNPLLVVNGRANLNHIPPVRKVKPIVQDAIVIQNTLQRQNQSTRY